MLLLWKKSCAVRILGDYRIRHTRVQRMDFSKLRELNVRLEHIQNKFVIRILFQLKFVNLIEPIFRFILIDESANMTNRNDQISNFQFFKSIELSDNQLKASKLQSLTLYSGLQNSNL